MSADRSNFWGRGGLAFMCISIFEQRFYVERYDLLNVRNSTFFKFSSF